MPIYFKKYKPGQKEYFSLSRSKIELFINCPACFWLDRVEFIKQPQGPPFLINSAVDQLLKNEFDHYREKEQPHPWMKQAKIDATPFQHENLNRWRENFKGIRHQDKDSKLELFGAVDDLWINNKTGKIHVIEYKSTSKKDPIEKLGDLGIWGKTYQRQLAIYKWLLEKNDLPVSKTAYFVYVNGDNSGQFSQKPFLKKLGKVEFAVNIFDCDLTDIIDVSQCLLDIKKCLDNPLPKRSPDCYHCQYVAKRVKKLFDSLKK